MIIKNDKRVSKIYDGTNVIQRIFKGTSKVFEYLPAGYKECEYLESTGTQYIDTGIIPSNYNGNYSTEITCQVDSLPSSSVYYLCGCAAGTGRSCNVYTSTTGSMGVYGGTSSAVINVSINAANADVLNKNTYKYIMTNNDVGQIIKDGTTYKGTNAATTTSSVSLYLFRARFSTRSTPMKLYQYKIWDNNNNLVRNFIPCLDSNDVPCLYDLVTKTTYYNAGTGTFNYKLA